MACQKKQRRRKSEQLFCFDVEFQFITDRIYKIDGLLPVIAYRKKEAKKLINIVGILFNFD